MKAVLCRTYGSLDAIHCEEMPVPVPGDDQILIKVRAAALNPLDWHLKRGSPPLRLSTGLFRPKNPGLGVDAAGIVETVGKNVSEFKPGDEVFGPFSGALAEYACGSREAIALKPAAVSFEDAASVPVPAYTALKALRDIGNIQPGQTLLINGASGGVGTLTIQIAKWLGAEVTAVCSAGNFDLVCSLGADHAIDYLKENYTQSGVKYDVVIDFVANHPIWDCRKALNPGGIYIEAGLLAGWSIMGMIGRMIAMKLIPGRLVTLAAKRNKKDLDTIAELLASGRVRAVIDRRYTLDESADAIRYLETSRTRGKIIITI